MAEYRPFEQQLAEAWRPETWREVTVIVAVSGGADSVALLRAMIAIGQQTSGRLVAAHFNHQLRGAESDGDERFVEQLCEQLHVPCEIARATGEVSSSGDGLEAEARELRYEFLGKASQRWGARYVAIAHTADDQAETVLHRVLRGTGLAGLAGIPETRPLSEMTTIIRPLLSVSCAAVRAYLQSVSQSFREDSSNRELTFTRNRIRHQLMPLLNQHINAQTVPSLLRLACLAQEAQQLVDSLVDPLLEKSVTLRTPNRVELVCALLRNERPYLVRELFMRIWRLQSWPRQEMGEAKWRQLGELFRATDTHTAGFTLPGNIQVELSDQRLVLRRR